jgi:hypothetical protein
VTRRSSPINPLIIKQLNILVTRVTRFLTNFISSAGAGVYARAHGRHEKFCENLVTLVTTVSKGWNFKGLMGDDGVVTRVVTAAKPHIRSSDLAQSMCSVDASRKRPCQRGLVIAEVQGQVQEFRPGRPVRSRQLSR